MAERRKKAARPVAPVIKRTSPPDSLRVAFQIGSFMRDAQWAILRSNREKDPSRLLQALSSLDDADSWLNELCRLLPKRSKRSMLLIATEAAK